MSVAMMRDDALALRALATGEATPGQQARALRFIIEDAAATYDMSFHIGDPHATSFSEGRRFVGNAIIRGLRCDLEKLPKETSGAKRPIIGANHLPESGRSATGDEPRADQRPTRGGAERERAAGKPRAKRTRRKPG